PDDPVYLDEARRRVRESAADPVIALFESLRPDLLRFAHWLARDRSVAEDVVQETLLRAWRSRTALRDRAAIRMWLLTIVRREHARLYERKRLELTNLHDAIEREDCDLAAEGDGEIVALRLAIWKLPQPYREPLVMQVLGGFSVEEIGREMNLTTSAVLTRLFRARNKLRASFGLEPAPDDTSVEDVQ
ncbi:MAG: sigma-70 family RNA polymerase sigma factor, partial [Steroidobacteraceae bacterium]